MVVPLTHLAGRTVAVFGLARSGLATVSAAVAGGAARVRGFDDREAACADAAARGAEIAPFDRWDWERIDHLVLAPGVPFTHPEPHPVVRAARAAGVGIVCDIELLSRETGGRARFVGVTGTNGKSTTTALIGHVLSHLGVPASVGGNIGRSALDLSPPEAPDSVYVLELSSYQLDLCDRFRPDIGVFLNLTPDHLERHGGIAGYRAAKERLFRGQGPGDTAVLGVDEPVMREIAAALKGRGGPAVCTIAVAAADAHLDGAGLVVDAAGRLHEGGVVIADLAPLPGLRGQHNWQNAAAALAATRALGCDVDAILAAMATFPGLDHRMQVIGRRGRVLFVNDSKATNAEAAARALATFDPVYWIAGGRAKYGGVASLASRFDRIAKAYLIGEAADAFAATLARRLPFVIAGDLATAVPMAAADAALDPAPEPVVLLAPAAASFDQFSDFEARGAAFAAAFGALDERTEEEALT